jgi:hypothetical protein
MAGILLPTNLQTFVLGKDYRNVDDGHDNDSDDEN